MTDVTALTNIVRSMVFSDKLEALECVTPFYLLSSSIREAYFWEGAGGAHRMEQQIEKRVIEIAKRNQDKMAEETGIQSSLTEEDMKEYLEQVIREVKMRKTTSKTNDGKT